MNNGMVRGSDVKVEPATRENGYVELTPEAAKNPWTLIGKSYHQYPLYRACTYIHYTPAIRL